MNVSTGKGYESNDAQLKLGVKTASMDRDENIVGDNSYIVDLFKVESY